MPRHNPRSLSYLDELAQLLASGSQDATAISERTKKFRRLLCHKYGMPFWETEDVVHEAVAGFLESVHAPGATRRVVTGKYLWTIARNRYIDGIRKTSRLEPLNLDGSEEPNRGSVAYDDAKNAYEEKQKVVSLHLFMYQVGEQFTERTKALLGRDLTAIVQAMQLSAAVAPTVTVALREAAAQLVSDGVLTKKNTKNIKKRLVERADLRLELSMPPLESRPSKPKPSAEE